MRTIILSLAILTSLPAYAADATKADLAAITKASETALRDPTGAQFHHVQVVQGYVCGWINARNGFGGFSGFVPFAGQLEAGRFTFTTIADDSSDAVALAHDCRSHGLELNE